METEITAVDKLLTYLFADKTAVYIDDIIVGADKTYEASWCRDFTLKNNRPQWHDTTITRSELISFIITERLNYWEAFRYDDATGSIQPFTNCTRDVETFLDENYRDVIKEFIGSLVH
ncbi:hypothetical protein BEL04_10825 [Mucilaginibacter sp. PPCGB 2223]|uniref:hypothetical protein n=1 Tax=Mucilaginibacter sp. PPCGB 2223 TaxID=1886027 RepID=UPI0008264685|nr:hypothetical protein [Mucilaginibacter sp. PPCGB 2223]OCX54709.1 hypothetical protein BEL04_10825 [Mucilaginibacter sp. PPCGB 2223]